MEQSVQIMIHESFVNKVVQRIQNNQLRLKTKRKGGRFDWDRYYTAFADCNPVFDRHQGCIWFGNRNWGQ